MIGDFLDFIHLRASTAASRMAQVEQTIMTKLEGPLGAGAKRVTIFPMISLLFNNVTPIFGNVGIKQRYVAHLTSVFLEYRLDLRTLIYNPRKLLQRQIVFHVFGNHGAYGSSLEWSTK